LPEDVRLAGHATTDAVAAMSFNRTKFQPPGSANGGVLREHLLASLQEQTHARMVLLLAPAGYGKTTLMGQWMDRLAAAGQQASWLTLDATDNDPVRLSHYLYGALRGWMHVALGTGGIALPAQTDWMSLLERVDPSAPQLTLFLDEFEKLTDPAALVVTKLLIGRLPRSIRLVIGSRDKPRLGLERYRVRGELIELTVSNLRFSTDETRRFLDTRFTHPLAGWLIDKVQSMTDGWPAALQLTALATRSQQDLERYTLDLSGGLSNVADYLAEDVLQAQPPDVRDFLLDTCNLPRLGTEVCNAATGRQDSARMLHYLERHGLFTSAVDAQHLWFRYHPLFVEFLQSQQAALLEPGRVTTIRRAAAHWFSQHGMAIEAVDLWLLAGDTEAAIREMATCAPALVVQAQFGIILRWIQRLAPAALASAGPELPLAAAWACGFGGDVQTAMRWVSELEPKLAGEPGRRDLHDELLGLQAVLLAFSGDIDAALQAGLAHWDRIGGTHGFAAGALANVMSYCLIRRGDFARAQEFSAIARACNERVGSALGLGYALTISGSIEAIQGRFDRAMDICAEVDRMATLKLHQPWFDSTHVKLASIGLVAAILYEQDRIDESDELLQRYYPLVTHQPSLDMRLMNQLVRARLRLAQGDTPGALETLELAIQAGEHPGSDLARRLLGWERVRIDLVAGRTATGLALADALARQETPGDDTRQFLYVEELNGRGIETARYLIARGDPAAALAQLDARIAESAASHRRWRLLKLRLLRVLALDALHERGAAQAELLEALQLGQQINARRSFADEGPRLDALLAELPVSMFASSSQREAVIRYWHDLRGEFSIRPVPDTGARPVLSDRERSILGLLAIGLGNEQIAAQVFLSVNTVKWHIRRLLEKLAARNRSEAVFIARQLNLL
jgi:LuxR family maltose regulon positive regulatory protein